MWLQIVITPINICKQELLSFDKKVEQARAMVYQEASGAFVSGFNLERMGMLLSVLAALLLHAALLMYYRPLTAGLASAKTTQLPVMEMFAVETRAVQPAPATPISVPTPAPIPAPIKVAPKTVEQKASTVVKKTARALRSITQPSTPAQAVPPVENAASKPAVPSAPVLVKKPQFLTPPAKPIYPAVARRRGQQGTVWLEILLSESGRQMQLSVVRSSGFQTLDEAAKVAVADWKLAPYRMNGVAVLSRVQVPVAFVIQ